TAGERDNICRTTPREAVTFTDVTGPGRDTTPDRLITFSGARFTRHLSADARSSTFYPSP
ncbi:MAG: hypothetical protein M3361_12480, partial [Candidatus Tectomicrobia bacterium]|nr:hypothetical protein [Candidatus Tectomicrobia bacterium]